MSKYNTAQALDSRLGMDAFMRRLFMAPFYKQHAGSFLFLFVLFLGSFMFINYLGKMSSGDSFFWHFILLIFLVTHQFMVLLFLVVSAGYLIKSRLFVKGLMMSPAYYFLRDSLGSLNQKKQWWHWFKLQISLSLPLLIYGVACLIMSIFKGVVLYGMIITVFLILGMAVIASLNFRQLIRVPCVKVPFVNSYIKVRWNQTMWMALMYCLKKERTALLLTKGGSVILALLMVHWQKEQIMTSRQWWLSFLLIGAAHVVLGFKTSLFMETRFKQLMGLQTGFIQGFLFSVLPCYMLLLLPELLIVAGGGYFHYAVTGYFSELILLFFYHYFSAYLEYELKALLKSGFLLLCVAFVLTLYGWFWLVLTGYFVISVALYGRRYFCLS
ncbi:hypothetical protein SAMN05192529_12729 [Arachidicoccus rhizosphaerae]|uniref:Uncharacterized protein n=1 Tax=Arachidicoccus rhizosphaerae TaxID=551991 RepID=A0A1H4C4D3_9BACT|nr:hypothetical protein [Arachidicoccus rhizosphaerae]SEA55241.1 hypothetical protein SAMN05192529_12729 [Arachidicoccus rhizosphaerae]